MEFMNDLNVVHFVKEKLHVNQAYHIHGICNDIWGVQ